LINLTIYYLFCQTFLSVLCLTLCLCVIASYDRRSTSVADARRTKVSGVVKTEAVTECEIYGSHSVVTDKWHTAAVPVGCEARVSHLPRELDLMLTDVQDVIDCDSTESCDQSTTPSVPLSSLELQPSVASACEAQVSKGDTQPACSAGESSTVIISRDNGSGAANSVDVTASKLLSVKPRGADRDNALAEVFARNQQSTGLAAHKQHGEPKKHS